MPDSYASGPKIFSFDRILTIVALLIALTGGIPTLLGLLEKRTFFELSFDGPPKFDIQGNNFVVEVPLNIFNASESSETIFAIRPEVTDSRGQSTKGIRTSFWQNELESNQPFPQTLKVGEHFKFPMAFYIPIGNRNQQLKDAFTREKLEANKFKDLTRLPSSLRDAEHLSDDTIRNLFRNTFFEYSTSMDVQMRAACDAVGMERGILSHCVDLYAALSGKRTTRVGEVAISFFPRMER